MILKCFHLPSNHAYRQLTFIVTSLCLKTKKWSPPTLCRKGKLFVKSQWNRIKLDSLSMKYLEKLSLLCIFHFKYFIGLIIIRFISTNLLQTETQLEPNWWGSVPARPSLTIFKWEQNLQLPFWNNSSLVLMLVKAASFWWISFCVTVHIFLVTDACVSKPNFVQAAKCLAMLFLHCFYSYI